MHFKSKPLLSHGTLVELAYLLIYLKKISKKVFLLPHGFKTLVINCNSSNNNK